MAENDGGPAFPSFVGPKDPVRNEGMSLRDWFAGMALHGIAPTAMPEAGRRFDAEMKKCYRIADGMLAARG